MISIQPPLVHVGKLEKIFQSKAKLLQLQEVVLKGSISGAKAILIHKNEMGRAFRLNRAQYALDGTPIFNRFDMGEGDLDSQKEIEIFSGSIAPGTHQISVYLEYRGHGYGVISYLNGYRFKIKSSYTFTAEEGKATTVEIVGYEKGGITTQLADRPAVRYDIETTRSLRSEDDGLGSSREATYWLLWGTFGGFRSRDSGLRGERRSGRS